MTLAHINRIGTAVPAHDVHQAFIGFVGGVLPDERSRRLFARMARRAGIEHRYSHLAPGPSRPSAARKGRGTFPGLRG